MIVSFLSVQRLPAEGDKPERFQIGFLDSEERSWAVWLKTNPTSEDLGVALAAMTIIAANPEKAAQMGFISMEAFQQATEARNQMRLLRGATPERKM